jgi:hypothetical protein
MGAQELKAAWARIFGKRAMPANRRVAITKLALRGDRPKLTPEEFMERERRHLAAHYAPCEHGTGRDVICQACRAEKALLSEIESGSLSDTEIKARVSEIEAGVKMTPTPGGSPENVEDLIGTAPVDPIAEAAAKLKQARRK